jgi:hypothetical protein
MAAMPRNPARTNSRAIFTLLMAKRWDHSIHSAWAAGDLFLIVPALQDCGVLLVHFDEVDQGLDSEVGERHRAVVVVPVHPDDSIFDVHLVSDVKEPVHALAKFLRDTVDRFDVMNLVNVHYQAACAGVIDDRARQFHGNSSSSRCLG